MIIALILAVLLGVILGAIFTAHRLEQLMNDRLHARDEMWQQALRLQADRTRL